MPKFKAGDRVTSADGPGTVLEYVKQRDPDPKTREYVIVPGVLHDDGTLRAYREADLTPEA